ncbi:MULTISPECIES: hypothetical protein [unclassified Thioalkalivibrio]|uniref:DUF2201 family putative metallopeptidase n=1 Tax=unclassified Thioalkalivibrio TaxID=2621013 RepID=UPI00035EBC49|nr:MULTISPECIES: hypothetical protein [unclassified Thioalkalivibrio]
MSEVRLEEDSKKFSEELARAPRLNTDDKMQDILEEYVEFFSGNNASGVPRFGALSILLRSTPVYCYDHPMLTQVCRTAFTTGHHIFFHRDFLAMLIKEDAESRQRGEKTQSLIPVLAHEGMHMMLKHLQRMRGIHPRAANIAADAYINPRVEEILSEAGMRCGPVFTGGSIFPGETKPSPPALGMSEEEKANYKGLSEEAIAIVQKKEREEKRKQQQNQPGGQGDPGGSGAPGIPDDGDGPQNPLGGDDPNDPSGNDHLVSVSDLKKALDKAGLKGVADKLKISDADTSKKQEALDKEADAKVQAALSEAREIRKQSESASRMPGGHVEDEIQEVIDIAAKSKLSWLDSVRHLIQGEGALIDYNDDIPHEIYYLEEDEIGFEPFYDGSGVPYVNENVVLFLVDSSGSMDREILSEVVTEAFGMVRQQDDASPELVVMSADTVIRGKPTILREDNWEEALASGGFGISGRGGTSFAEPINQAVEWATKNLGKRVSALIYASDMGAPAPRRSELPEEMPPTVFIYPKSCQAHAEAIRGQLSEYAEVVAIEDGTTVDLDAVRDPGDRPAVGMRP